METKDLENYETITIYLESELAKINPDSRAKFTYARAMRACRAVLKLHKPIPTQEDFDPLCEECTANYAHDINWPCETVDTILDGWLCRKFL